MKFHSRYLPKSFGDDSDFGSNVILHSEDITAWDNVHAWFALDKVECMVFPNRIFFFLDTWTPEVDIRRRCCFSV